MNIVDPDTAIAPNNASADFANDRRETVNPVVISIALLGPSRLTSIPASS
jgi:hypothetical protein